MLKRSLKYNLAISVGVIAIATSAIAFAQSSNKPLAPTTTALTDFAVDIQVSDRGCSAQFGAVNSTPSLSTGGGQSGWASDGSADYDCTRIGLNMLRPVAVGTLVSIADDFRLCVQNADNGLGNQTGTKQCTAWATESKNGSWSPWASDSNNYDPDSVSVFLEKRPNTKPFTVTDLRIGVQMSDKGCREQIGAARMTAWANEGGGWSSWASDTNYYDPDCTRVYLQTQLTSELCPLGTPNPPTVAQGSGTNIGIDGTGTGWKTCSNDSILTNIHLHNDNNDRKEHWGTCTDTDRLINASFAYTAANGTVLPAGQPRPVYPTSADAMCAADEALVGALYYDDDANGNNDEGIRAIQCRKLETGVTLDYNNLKVFPHAGCGKTFCDSYDATYGSLNLAKTADGRPFIPVGMNIRPNDNNKYSRGIWAAPLVVEEAFGTCENPSTDPLPPPPGVCNDGIDNDGDERIDSEDPSCVNGTESSTEPANPTCSFTANKTTIIRGVDQAILSWSCTGGTGSPSISNIGTVAAASSTAVSPEVTTTYTLTYGGITQGSITIQVNEPNLQEQ